MRYELLPIQVLYCFGPFTYSAPPEIEDGWYGTGWNDNLVEPDPEELEMMDRAAESLKLEFINGL